MSRLLHFILAELAKAGVSLDVSKPGSLIFMTTLGDYMREENAGWGLVLIPAIDYFDCCLGLLSPFRSIPR